MSTSTPTPSSLARSRIMARFAAQAARSTVSPSWDSFSETVESIPRSAMSLHGLQILPGRLARTGEVLDPLAEKVEDAADPPRVQVDRRGYRVRQLCSRDESVHRLDQEPVVGDRVLESGVLRSPQQQID